jgi:hypothetical protein
VDSIADVVVVCPDGIVAVVVIIVCCINRVDSIPGIVVYPGGVAADVVVIFICCIDGVGSIADVVLIRCCPRVVAGPCLLMGRCCFTSMSTTSGSGVRKSTDECDLVVAL